MLTLIQAMVRHLMTFGGGFLAADGLAADADIQTGVSAAVTLIGIVWSIVEKYKAKKAE